MNDAERQITNEVCAAVAALNTAVENAAKLGCEVKLLELNGTSFEDIVERTIYSPRITKVLA